MKLNDLNKSILIGLLLGDGYIDPKGRIYIEHCKEQLEYCIYKAKLLHSVVGGKDINVQLFERKRTSLNSNRQWRSGDVFITCKFKKQSKHFIPIRQLLYPNNKKTITKEVLEYLTPLSIALWWMDDGSLTRRKQKNGSPGPYMLRLYTFLSFEENALIRQYFIDKYNVYWNIQTANQEKDQYYLYCSQEQGKKFLEIVRDIIIKNVPQMSYKLFDI